jgi:putative molybdopterin biosynthesis protein
MEPVIGDFPGLVICGQDVLLDVLSGYLTRHPSGGQALRRYVGSFDGLFSLYKGKNMLATAHLWDGDSGEYNLPFVRRLIPGIPTVLVNIAWRMQGFYVAKGNPKAIVNWSDLMRSDVRFINREKGCGTRVLLDEQLRRLQLSGRTIRGYEGEEFSHLAVASAVARREADVGLGSEKAALQVQGIDFVPLQKERYDLVVKKDDLTNPLVQGVLEILRSREFQEEARGMGGYDITTMGEIVAEV